MDGHYVIGIDFGTLSGRAVLLDAQNGQELAVSELAYPHAVMDRTLPDGTPLPDRYALQHPQDYLDVLHYVIPDVLAQSNVAAKEVIGLGIDFTACTLLPLDQSGMPLCFRPEFAREPHAYVKLWKHHAAQSEADEITALAKQRTEKWIDLFGGSVSSEWAIPKILQILREKPDVYHATARFSEAADWLSQVLTGEESHAAAFAGYKACWRAENGYPSPDFFEALEPEMRHLIGTKLSAHVRTVDKIAGHLNMAGAALTGLPEGTAVALPMIDAHAAMPAVGAVDPNDFVMIIGTSTCHLMHGSAQTAVPGICGCVKDSVIPGCCTYEAGQACVGDAFAWFVDNLVPETYTAKAREMGISIHQLLRQKAARLTPGESGLIALDWFNGNRSILNQANLSGMILGLTLHTRPEEIYRALLEATAFGSRVILEQFERNGLAVHEIRAAGGIARKDPLMMQIYADVLGKPIRIADTTQAGAIGSAMYAAAAAGIYPSIQEAAKKMASSCTAQYRPDEKNRERYEPLYQTYLRLHDYFGSDANNMMSQLIKGKVK